MRTGFWIAGAIGVLAFTSVMHGQIIFSDQFETYTQGTYLSSASTGGVWEIDLDPVNCNGGKVTDTAISPPNGISDYKDGSTNMRLAFRNRHNLTTAEMQGAQLVEDPTPNCVDGTDNNSLKLEYQVYLGPWSLSYYYKVNQYMEITCGDDRAPTPMLLADCGGKLRHHLDIAGVNDAAVVHRSIAVGQIAVADPDPCDVPTEQVQQSYRLVVYDGLKWNYFTADDLHTCNGWNKVLLTIKSATIEISLTNRFLNGCAKANADNTRTISLDREYTGPFNSIVMGGIPDEEAGCLWDGNKDDGYLIQESAFDEVFLYDGVAKNVVGVCAAPGACCKPDHTCEQTTLLGCDALNGTFYEGSACGVGPGLCCSTPQVDYDYDQDVDMDDFAVLQRCLTTGAGTQVTPAGCECLDVDGQPGIGQTDVEKFIICGSGAGIDAVDDCLTTPAP